MRCPARGRRSRQALPVDRGSFLRVYSMKKEAFQAMGKWMGLVLAALFAVTAAGCANKQSKCKKGWNQVVDMGRSVSGLVNLAASAFGNKTFDLDSKIKEVEPKFMDACMQLSEEAVDCVADLKNKILDANCIMT